VFGKHVFRPILVVYPKKMSFCQKYKKYIFKKIIFFCIWLKILKTILEHVLKLRKNFKKKFLLHVEIQKILHEFYNIKDFSLYFKKILTTFF
jgi:hypothetical protein